MKLKLDENLGTRGAVLFRAAGHDVTTVPEQDLCGAVDGALIDVCGKEHRCLVTLDLDFSNPLLFRPADYAGIAVLRLPARPNPEDLWAIVQTLIAGLKGREIEGHLWIVRRGQIREYQPEEDGEVGG